MFIAVLPYCVLKNYILFADRVPVLDTEDNTVELASYQDLHDLDIEVWNLVGKRIVNMSIASLMLRHKLYSAYAHNDEFSFSVNNFYISMSKDQREYLVINGTSLSDICYTFEALRYFFLFKNYLVMRFSGYFGCWFSVVVDCENKVCAYWTDRTDICSNKELSQKIDMLSEV